MPWTAEVFAQWCLPRLARGHGHDQDSLEMLWHRSELYSWDLDFSGGGARVIGEARSRAEVCLRFTERRFAERVMRQLRSQRPTERAALLDSVLDSPPIRWRWE